MAAPLGRLGYLYIGTADFKRDLEYYTQVLGATVLWNYNEFGANVAGLRLSEGPQYLLADHRPAPSCLPLFEVKDLKAAAKDLRAAVGSRRVDPSRFRRDPVTSSRIRAAILSGSSRMRGPV